MQKDNESSKKLVPHYGKKIYALNFANVQSLILFKREPKIWYEDIEDDTDK